MFRVLYKVYVKKKKFNVMQNFSVFFFFFFHVWKNIIFVVKLNLVTFIVKLKVGTLMSY